MNEVRPLKFGLFSSREKFSFQLHTQSRATTVGKSGSALVFKVERVVGVSAGSKKDKVIHNFKVMTVNSGV